MRCFLCAALVSLLSVPGAAQSGSQRPEAKPAAAKAAPPGTLHSVAFKGAHQYKAEAIFRQTELKIGQRITPEILEQARQKLQNTQLFNNVSDSYRFSAGPAPEYEVTFALTENEQVFPMRFERLGVSPDAIREYLRTHVDLYADRIPGTEGVLRRYTEAVQEFVSQKDPSLKVKALVSNDDPQQLAVLFTANTPAPTIAQVTVSGNQAVDSGTILRAVNQVAVGVPLSDTRIKMILDGAIKPLYAAKGYPAVTFPKVETEPASGNLGVVLKVEIKDGPQFMFGAVRFRGQGLDEDEIRSNITFKPGQTFNAEQMDNFRIDLQHRLKRHGYLDATITTDTQLDDSKHQVNVSYNVSPGEIYNFDKLDITGLDVTTQPAVEKLWGEKAGKPFNPDYPDFFLKRLQEQGIFDNLASARSDYTADATNHRVVVHLMFKGGGSAKETERKKKEDEERRKADGTWSPYPPL